MKHYFRIIKYKLFGNFLGVKINISYIMFIFFTFLLNKIRKKNIKIRNEGIDTQINQLKNTGFLKIPSVVNTNEAKNISNLATNLIKNSTDFKKAYNNNNLSQNILNPCENLKIDINKILLNEKVKNILDNYFICDYRIKWIDFYRSQPSNEKAGSWLWHIDNYPIGIIKGMILFTDQNAQTGAMTYLSKKATYEIIKKKYYGISSEKREKNLNSIIDKDLSEDLTLFDGKAGDLFLFSGNQMHCANAPLSAHRDVSTFMIIPTLKKKSYKIDYQDIQTNYNFAKNPWTEILK